MFLRKDKRKIKRLNRRLSKSQKGSRNRAKARHKLGRAHLVGSRRRNDWVWKLAQRVIQSHDLVAIENLKVRNMVSQGVGRVSQLVKAASPPGRSDWRTRINNGLSPVGRTEF